MLHLRLRRPAAFTLLEVLVVIGVIAIAAGLLLPAVQKVKARAQGAMCESNLRTLSMACYQYTLQYDGRYPYGFIFNNQNPATGRNIPGTIGQISWFSLMDKFLSAGSAVNFPADGTSLFFDGSTKRRFSPAFRCPAVPSNFQQQVTYYQHGVVMPH